MNAIEAALAIAVLILATAIIATGWVVTGRAKAASSVESGGEYPLRSGDSR